MSLFTADERIKAAERIVELERALAHERAVSAAARRRCELLEDAARRAYKLAAGVRLTVEAGDAKVSETPALPL